MYTLFHFIHGIANPHITLKQSSDTDTISCLFCLRFADDIKGDYTINHAIQHLWSGHVVSDIWLVKHQFIPKSHPQSVMQKYRYISSIYIYIYIYAYMYTLYWQIFLISNSTKNSFKLCLPKRRATYKWKLYEPKHRINNQSHSLKHLQIIPVRNESSTAGGFMVISSIQISQKRSEERNMPERYVI